MSAKRFFDQFTLPLIMLAVFWSIAITLWLTTRHTFYLFNFGYIGVALAVGLGVYITLPARKKPLGRRLAQFLIGTYMLIFLGLIRRENMQIEAFSSICSPAFSPARSSTTWSPRLQDR